jgi:signal transduction histidine kinase
MRSGEHDTARRVSDARARDLGGRLIAAQEEERPARPRSARRLESSGRRFEIDVDRFTGDPGGENGESRSAEIKSRVDEIAGYVHRLAHELHPSKLQTLGLVAAIDSCCREVSSRHELDVQFSFEGVRRFVKPETSLCLYRIVQESLHNVVKHSGATDAEVRLRGTQEYLELRVADRGRGFRPEADHVGLGLVSMRERVSHPGGRIVFHSSPGGGTRIAVRIPTR